jgi:ferredoxin
MTKTYAVEINHQGTIYNLQVPENKTADLELPASCHAGVCTTCAALITEGSVDQSDGMGVSPELQKQGYALLCVAKPLSDLKIETDKEDVVYQKQFGKS